MVRLEIISPKAQVVSTEAFEVVLPTESGEIGVLSHHIPLITHLTMGVLSVFNEGQAERYVISGGYAQIKAEKVSILTDDATPVSDLNASDIEAKIKAIEERISEESSVNLKQSYISQLEFFKLQRSLVEQS